MSFSISPIKGMFFLPFPENKEIMISELKERFSFSLENMKEEGDLVYLSDLGSEIKEGKIPYWCRCALFSPLEIKFDSIGDAVKSLKSLQRSWGSCSTSFFRRTSLIQEKLPYINNKPKTFPFKAFNSPIGLFSLTDANTMIASAKTSSFFPAGRFVFVEDHINPPSRAYLKLQEALVMADSFFSCGLPDFSSRCFDAGASPGGWTYVLTQLGSKVFAVDRSPLVPNLMQNPLVDFLSHDAFTLKPEDLGDFDWVFSDVICYPSRLLKWIKTWLESGKVRNMICTIKLQGKTDWDLISEFEKIPRSRVIHLNYNKHELTFIHCEKK